MRSLTPGPELKFLVRVPAIRRMPEEITALNYTATVAFHSSFVPLPQQVASLADWTKTSSVSAVRPTSRRLRQQWRGARLPSIVTVPDCSTTSIDHPSSVGRMQPLEADM